MEFVVKKLSREVDEGIKVCEISLAQYENNGIQEWKGYVLVLPNHGNNTCGLSGTIRCGDEVRYLYSARGLNRGDGLIKFIVFPNEDPKNTVNAYDYVLRYSTEECISGVYYKVDEEGKDVVGGTVNLELSAIEGHLSETIKNNIDWWRNHRNGLFGQSEDKANMRKHCLNFDKEKELMAKIMLSKILKDNDTEEEAEREFKGLFTANNFFANGDDNDELSKLIRERYQEQDELLRLREPENSSLDDAISYIIKNVFIKFKYSVEIELLNTILWYYGAHCDKNRTNMVIAEALSFDEKAYVFRNELSGNNPKFLISDEEIKYSQQDVCSLIQMALKHYFTFVGRNLLIAIEKNDLDRVDALQEFLLLQTIAYISIAKNLHLESGLIYLDYCVSSTKSLLDTFASRREDLKDSCEKVSKYLDGLVADAQNQSASYLEAVKKKSKEEIN